MILLKGACVSAQISPISRMETMKIWMRVWFEMNQIELYMVEQKQGLSSIRSLLNSVFK